MKNRSERSNNEFKIKPEDPLIKINDVHTIFQHQDTQNKPLFLRESLIDASPLTVMDKETLSLTQILPLHKSVDHTISAAGSAMLLKSLILPNTDLENIRSKQKALIEIASNDRLRQGLTDYVQEYCNYENTLIRFFNKGINALMPYKDLDAVKKHIITLSSLTANLPEAESDYLKILLSLLSALKDSSVVQMMQGRIYMTFSGLKPGRDIGFFTPRLKFTHKRFSPWILAGLGVAAAPFIQDKINIGPDLPSITSILGLGLTGTIIFYSLFIKPIKDTENFIEPLRRHCISDLCFSQAVDVIGKIDELLSFQRFAQAFPYPSVLPDVFDDQSHFFEAQALRNPVIAGNGKDFIPNNVSLRNSRLTFISGPNSGGKTTICKSIVQNQLLAQAGSYIAAEKAAINIADRICYQAPKFDGLEDSEGRFGTELSRTRDIFYSTSPKSLVILDELAEGTTYEEQLKASFEILSDFAAIGNTTILVTHNHSLIDRFKDDNKGNYLMVLFKEDQPAYKIVPGISRVSHAEKIASKINFSKQDRLRYLKTKGYL